MEDLEKYINVKDLVTNLVFWGIVGVTGILATLHRKLIWDKVKPFINIKVSFRKKPELPKVIFTKDSIKILFVDDQEMPIVENLDSAGWDVRLIKDITDLKSDEIINRQIIFVDYDGVGRKFSEEHQGVELIKILKDEYKETKFVVLYTSMANLPTDTTFTTSFDLADDKMRKNANTSEFIDKINKAIKKLNGNEEE